MDTNKKDTGMMEELSLPDNIDLKGTDIKKTNKLSSQNTNYPGNGFNQNINNSNSFQNGINNNIPGRNFNNNGPNNNTPGRNFFNNGPNNNTPGRNFFNNGPNNNTPGRYFFNNGPNNNTPGRNSFNNVPNNNIPGKSSFNNGSGPNNPNVYRTVSNHQNRYIPQSGPNPVSPYNRPQQYPVQRQVIKPKRPLTKEEMTKQKVKQFYNRTGVCLLIHDVLIFIIQIFLGIVLAFSSISLRDVKDYLADESTNVGIAVASVLSYVAANIICAFLGLSITKRTREFPKLYCAPKIKFLPALLAFPAVLGFQGVISLLHNGYFIIMNLDLSSETTVNDMSTSVMIVYFIYSVLLAPVTEEILFRGMVLKNLSVIDERFAIIFSGFLFGLFHENVLQMITATLLGIFLAYVAVKTDSIILPTLLHMFNNLYVEVQSMFPESKTKTAVIFTLYGIGIVSAVLFFIITRKKESFQNNYKPLFDTLPYEERGLKLSAALSSPAIIVYLVIIMVLLSIEVLATFFVSWFS